MAKMKIKWTRGGFDRLRADPAVVADLNDRAERIAAAAGEGFVAHPAETVRRKEGGTRSRAAVSTTDVRSMVRNAREHTLLSNLDAGR